MGKSLRPTRRQGLAATLGLIAALALGTAAGLRSAHWLDTESPGFFVDPALNVSLLSLPGWPSTAGHWPSAVTHVAGVAIAGPDEVYGAVRGAADASGAVTYRTSRLGVAGPDLKVQPRRLANVEYALLFVGLLVNGLLTIAVALSVWRRQPNSPAAVALLIAGTALGTLAITTVAVISDGSLARLNILAQCAAAAGILHLALVFPVDLLPKTRAAAMFAIYAPFAALALVYQLTWPDPYGTGLMHGAASAAVAAATAVLLAGLLLRLWSRRAVVVRRRAAIAMSGVAGVAAVTVSWISATGLDWRAGSAALLTCGALIPFAIGGAIAARDFFVLDQRLRSILTYALAIPMVAVLYGGALYLIGPRLAAAGAPLAVTLPFLAANVAVILAIAPVVRLARGWVDRLFSPESYSVDRSLESLNRGLSAARTTQTVVGNTTDILRRTLRPSQIGVFLRGRGAGFPVYAHDDPEERRIAVPSEIADLLEADEIAFRHQLDDSTRHLAPHLLDRFRADLLVPISRAGSCVGMIALGGKQSGHPYDGRDIAFTRAAANQIALALPNAAAQDRLEVLHATLEELTENLRLQVNRTEALKATNAELAAALSQLRSSQHRFAENQHSALRAERLGALERLGVALTQELSGPLAAVLVALRDIGRLGKGEVRSNHDAERQRYAIEQIMAHAENGAAWLERTIAYLRSFQSLSSGDGGDSDRFALRDAFAEALHLLRPRLQDTGCKALYSESPEALELEGSRQRFVLVLVDLIGAAIEAYRGSSLRDPQINVEAELTSQGISVSVIDWANGLPTAAIPQLLDQLASDQLIGNRRGLWIAKNLVEEGFGGSLEVTTDDAMTCFTIAVPHRFGRRGEMAPPPSLRLAAND